VTAEIAQPRPTASQWLAAARPRTLPAAISPVVAASGIAAYEGGFALLPAALALIVALALQVGVNYANDYSDGIRGADTVRVGPLRLVGSGLARPAAVRAAAFASFGIAALAGLALVIATRHWWLLIVGAASILAAWYYTGGKRPYGYRGLGELFVFVFFGLVATCGTGYVQTGGVSPALAAAAVAIGAFACAILVVNNLRDIEGDRAVGKRTLATRLGYRGTRAFYIALVSLGAIMINVVAALTSAWALLGLLGLVMIIPAARTVLAGNRGPTLIGVLKTTGLAELVAAIGLAAGLLIAA
jgi:1,4-dihydroxy-2-naphthoate polyprenyltransferase